MRAEQLAAAHQPGRAVITLLPADAPPPAVGAHEPGPGASPVVPIVIDDAGVVTGTTGDADADAALVAAAAEALEHGRSRTVEAAGRRRSDQDLDFVAPVPLERPGPTVECAVLAEEHVDLEIAG